MIILAKSAAYNGFQDFSVRFSSETDFLEEADEFTLSKENSSLTVDFALSGELNVET